MSSRKGWMKRTIGIEGRVALKESVEEPDFIDGRRE